MKLRTVEITVGVFIIAGILSLLMLALQVSGLSHFFKTENGYQVKAEFSNIGGLKPRAKVAVAGVVVGRVTKIQLEPDSFNATVWLSIDPSRVQSLPSDSRASILTAGLLGDNYISLTPGFSEKPLKDGGFISVMDTDSAIVLEQLVSRFLANQVSAKQANLNDTPSLVNDNGKDDINKVRDDLKSDNANSDVVKPEIVKSDNTNTTDLNKDAAKN